MSDQIRTTKETELATEEEVNELNEEVNEVDNEEETQPSKKQLRREKVFKACDELEEKGINVTRDNVIKHSGGSGRDVGTYVKEWRQSKNKSEDDTDNEANATQNTNTTNDENTAGKLVVQGGNDIIQNKNENNIQTSSEVLETTPINSYNDPDNAAEVAISALNRVTGMIETEEKIVQHFFKNPNQMPEEFKQKISKAKNETNALIKERSATFEVDFFMKKALMSLEK